LRALNHIIYTPRAAAEVIVNLPTLPTKDSIADSSTTSSEVIKCGILFGRERNGLYNEEVNLCDSIISIPTFNHFTSLNLAQAVNIVGYELWNRKIALDESAAPPVWFQPKSGDRLARKVELENFLLRLEDRLTDREYQKDKSREALYFQIIRNIFQRVSYICMLLLYLYRYLSFYHVPSCLFLFIVIYLFIYLESAISSRHRLITWRDNNIN
jgi:tRNA C32,U32 (ribose-2'-O)-methylase TrmJ